MNHQQNHHQQNHLWNQSWMQQQHQFGDNFCHFQTNWQQFVEQLQEINQFMEQQPNVFDQQNQFVEQQPNVFDQQNQFEQQPNRLEIFKQIGNNNKTTLQEIIGKLKISKKNIFFLRRKE